jgi:hypothetical protein
MNSVFRARSLALPAVFALLAIAACTSTTSTTNSDAGGVDAAGDGGASTDASPDRGSSEAGGGCGISFAWGLTGDAGKTSAQCQAWLDASCCTEQRACGADAACKAFVECVNRCTLPRTDACLLACSGDGAASVQAEIDAIATCSKNATGGEGCAWP